MDAYRVVRRRESHIVSIHDEVNAFFYFIFSIYLILTAALCPGVYSASNRNV
jgi:hypothetical protein